MKVYWCLFLVLLLFGSCTQSAQLSGELKTWHKITLTFEGPSSSETASPNPFTDYRLQVVFSQGENEFSVPGYFAADGKAAYTSASEGNKWRVHFSPHAAGEWNYKVSFRKGEGIATNGNPGESAGYMDGLEGSFQVEPTDKTGRDMRARGRLQYVDEYYLQFAEDGTYFIKCGADAPENLLAYYELDHTPNVGERLKKWDDHARDYHSDADGFLWGAERGKGKNILGAISYLSEKGMNAFSFLTFNVDGDDRNVFPHLLKASLDEYEERANDKETKDLWESAVVHDRFDVSKMDQWELIFSYGETKGMFLHFKTQETENDHKMDGGELGPDRKLYYRELIARYGHHLAMNWNLGEENTQATQQVKEEATFFATLDPYSSPIVLHTYPEQHEKVYRPLLGSQSALTGISIQTKNSDFSLVHDAVNKWVNESANAGKKWVVAVDERGDAGHALLPDEENPDHDNARINALWGTYLAGGYGTEWYFGYKHAHSDLTCESWRSRDLFWDQGKIALDFFKENAIPVTEMKNMDELTASENDFIYAKPGEVYLVYSKTGEPFELNLPNGEFQLKRLNPKTGKMQQLDPVKSAGTVKIEAPSPQDWLFYFYR